MTLDIFHLFWRASSTFLVRLSILLFYFLFYVSHTQFLSFFLYMCMYATYTHIHTPRFLLFSFHFSCYFFYVNLRSHFDLAPVPFVSIYFIFFLPLYTYFHPSSFFLLVFLSLFFWYSLLTPSVSPFLSLHCNSLQEHIWLTQQERYLVGDAPWEQ